MYSAEAAAVPVLLAALLAAMPAAAETYRCDPALPFYCANIHIGCAGRSRRPGEAFVLRIDGELASARFVSGQEVELSVHRDARAAVLRDRTSPDWIRLSPDGTFVHRIQSLNPALMMRGRCVPAQVPDATR